MGSQLRSVGHFRGYADGGYEGLFAMHMERSELFLLIDTNTEDFHTSEDSDQWNFNIGIQVGESASNERFLQGINKGIHAKRTPRRPLSKR